MRIYSLVPHLILWTSAVASITFDYTGNFQSWTVPSNVTSIRAILHGASAAEYNGGKGGMIEADVAVTAGEIIRVYVGGEGGIEIGGFNGGGNAFHHSAAYGNAGGGATDIRRSPYDLSNRMVVAGGGGGSSGWFLYAGGFGGFPNGTEGTRSHSTPFVLAGGGGTQSSGGHAGWEGRTGTFGMGASYEGRGCGGGGGWYGGGSANNRGCGGGSSYTSGILISHSTGGNTGNGSAIIAWDVLPTALPTSQPSSQPSQQPSLQPSLQPSNQPSSQPSNQPSDQPLGQPSNQPAHPTAKPIPSPTAVPTTASPTSKPTPQVESTPLRPKVSPFRELYDRASTPAIQRQQSTTTAGSSGATRNTHSGDDVKAKINKMRAKVAAMRGEL